MYIPAAWGKPGKIVFLGISQILVEKNALNEANTFSEKNFLSRIYRFPVDIFLTVPWFVHRKCYIK